MTEISDCFNSILRWQLEIFTMKLFSIKSTEMCQVEAVNWENFFYFPEKKTDFSILLLNSVSFSFS